MYSIEEEKQHRIWEEKYDDVPMEDLKEIDSEAHDYFANQMSDDELMCYDYEMFFERKIDESNF